MADTLPTENEGMRAMAVQLFERNAKAYQAAALYMAESRKKRCASDRGAYRKAGFYRNAMGDNQPEALVWAVGTSRNRYGRSRLKREFM